MKHFWTHLKKGINQSASTISQTIKDPKNKENLQKMMKNSNAKLKHYWQNMPASIKNIKKPDLSKLNELKDKAKEKMNSEQAQEVGKKIHNQLQNAKTKIGQIFSNNKQSIEKVEKYAKNVGEKGLNMGKKILNRTVSNRTVNTKTLDNAKNYLIRLVKNQEDPKAKSIFEKNANPASKTTTSKPLNNQNSGFKKQPFSTSQTFKSEQQKTNKSFANTSFFERWWKAQNKPKQQPSSKKQTFQEYWKRLFDSKNYSEKVSGFIRPLSKLKDWSKKKAWSQIKARFPNYLLKFFILSAVLSFAYGLGRSLPRETRLFLETRRQKQKHQPTN